MGRYYDGDIEGKFWFGVQSSDDADHFGVVGTPPGELRYYFTEDNIEGIKEGIQLCKDELGTGEEELRQFFEKNNGYNDTMLVEQTSLKRDEIHGAIELYARLRLGEEILECVEKQGECSFTAER